MVREARLGMTSATKIIKITSSNSKNPTFRVCPSATIKIINVLIKEVKFTNKFFSVYMNIVSCTFT